ncbi:GNAT family N-acetyltransferase [Nocardioides koreensis]|uniref:GNAT family N-acetyltransferase n=1 Tax=Nocardioides koreensis TaxID=433651 RepID=A0ABN3A7V5_9ACTN
MADIARIDPHDDAALRAWFGVEQASIRADRPQALSRTYAALATAVRHPSPYVDRPLLAAVEGGATVGVAEVELTTQDNLHLAELAIHVHPDHRRRGIGRALHDAAEEIRRAAGRSTVVGELLVADGNDDPAGMAFARALGFGSVHQEEHLVLPLPVDPAGLPPPPAVTAYEIVIWRDRCPDEHVAAFCAMRTQMGRDVPVGEVAYEPPVIDEERLRSSEERTRRAYHRIVAAARRREDGEMAGYSVVFLAHDDHEALQDDTLVMPDHRGHRLGLRLKLATLEVLGREHPDRRMLHTWSDRENHAMYRTNVAIGYRRAEVLHEMQREDPS